MKLSVYSFSSRFTNLFKLNKTSLLVLIGCVFFSIQYSFAQFDIPPIPSKSNGGQTSVYDYVNLLTASEKKTLENKLIKYSDTTSTQIVTAIIATTKGESISYLSTKWAHEWGIGQANEDNGIFILLARDDRKIWIATGYGVDQKLTAGITGEIIRNDIIPYFKQNNYYGGLNAGADVIFEVMTGEYKGTRQSNDGGEFPIVFFILLFIIFIIILISISKNRRGGNGTDNFGGGSNTTRDILEAIILSNSGRGGYSRSSGGFGGGGFGSGSSGGGFGGGFGGGGFSGGGAGGSW